MVKTKFILMIILLALVAKEGTMAQTHYRRIPAIELDYGTNVFGKANNFVALSISKYISRKSYWKVGVNYFEKTFQYDIPISGEEISSTSPVTTEEAFKDSKAKDWYLDGSYNYTIASNLKSIFWNIGIGAFIGTEYSDGTIRNKVVIGQKRTSIYLSNLIICALVSVVMCAAFFIAYLCIGIPLLGFFEMDIKQVLLFTLAVFVLAIAFASIFTLISMLNHNKAITAVVCILLAFLLLFAGAQFNKMLNEPETNMGLMMTDNGQEYQEIPNPNYLEGGERKVVQFLYDFVPGGQALQCVSLEANNITVLPAYSLIIIVLTTGFGVFFFKKKELK